MPSFSEAQTALFENAIELIDTEILRPLQATEIDSAIIAHQFGAKAFVRGWRFDVATDVGDFGLNLLIKASFPITPTGIALENFPPPLTYPHIEDDGLLCLAVDTDSLYAPVQSARKCIQDSIRLVVEGYSGKNKGEFRTEFNSYWLRSWTGDKVNVISLLSPSGPSRLVSVIRAGNAAIIGEDDKSVTAWYSRYKGTTDVAVEKGAVFWLSELPLPTDFPAKNSEVARLVASSPNATNLLDELADGFPNAVAVLIAGTTEDGPAFGGTLIKKAPSLTSDFIKKGQPLTRGFRPGRIPASISRQRYWSSGTAIARGNVTRADRKWVHSRGNENVTDALSAVSIALVGCGSLGGFLAKLLATAGVAKLLLIDNEPLTWPNTGRHFLGASSVGEPKATELATGLQRDYPHLEIDSRNRSLADVLSGESEALLNTSLIVSATGDWGSENLLNLWQFTNENAPPIVYTWLEPYAVAGHALAIVRGMGCFKCGFDDAGEFLYRASDWSNVTIMKEPACGVTFQPYGAIEAMHAVTLAARLCLDFFLGDIAGSIHRASASMTDEILQEHGGAWTQTWLDSRDALVHGPWTETEWQAKENCRVCGANE